jgi:NAD(P)H dehydrogenase (quinone)
VPEEILVQSGAKKAREAFAHIPMVRLDDLVNADALVFGTPTRFGNMCSQMRNFLDFLDQTRGLWARAALAGKVGSIAFSSARVRSMAARKPQLPVFTTHYFITG